MTRSRKIKLVAIVAVFAMVLPLLLAASLNAVTDPMSSAEWSDLDVFYEEEIAPVDTNITPDSFVIGETVYDPDLTSTTALPAGWLAGPSSLSTWYNAGGSGVWDTTIPNTDTTNTAPKTNVVMPTADGVKVTTAGNGDFSVLFPSLKNSKGQAVTNYVFTAVINYVGDSKGSAGLITASRGSENTFKGGSYFMLYGPGDTSSHRIYKFNGARTDLFSYSSITKTGTGGINYTTGQDMTLTVYFCDGINYYYVNGNHIFTTPAPDYYNGASLNGIGLNFSTTKNCLIKDIVVKELAPKVAVSSDIKLGEPTIRYCSPLGVVTGDDSEGLRFTATVDKTSDTYKNNVSGTYAATNENVKFGMLLIPEDLIPDNGLITVDTPNVLDTVVEKIDSQDDNSLTYAVSLLNIPDAQRDRVYVARAYMKVKNGSSWSYTYSKTKVSRSYAGVANICYTESSTKAVRDRLDEMFEGANTYEGGEAKTLTFSLFADLHYYPGGYITPVSHLTQIMAKAKANNVDFVMQAGDFCNNFPGSPEIVNAYLGNSYNLPAYGVMGNHDLENGGKLRSGTTTTDVTSNLTNRNDSVVWGTADGKIGDGSIAYYYFDVNGFRVVCTDTNYYYYVNGDVKEYRHYPSWYAGPGSDAAYAEKTNCLGDTQRAWLEKVLMDAAENDIPCIVVTHASTAGTRGSSQCGDYKEVQEIFRKANNKNLGTVLMAINGHHHTNHTEYVDGILYFDMNTSNGAYVPDGSTKTPNYAEDATFEYVEYDDNGNATSTSTKLITTLGSLGQNEMFYFEGPLSAIVHVSSNGRIIIEGDSTDWYLDVAPANPSDGEEPFVNSGVFNVGQH